MASQVNEGTWTLDVQKEDAKENTWTYKEEVRGELWELIGEKHRNRWLLRNAIKNIESKIRCVKSGMQHELEGWGMHKYETYESKRCRHTDN